MDYNKINSDYWKNVEPQGIIGKNAIPGDELLKLLSPEAAILDLGCGDGLITEALATKRYKVTGMDINPKVIEFLRSRSTSGATYVTADAMERLPFDDNSFAAIVMSFFLLNIMPTEARKNLVRELSRVLTSQGLIWLNEPLVSPDYEIRYKISRPLVGEDYDFFVFNEGVDPKEITTTKRLEQAIKKGETQRVTHHFPLNNLKSLFGSYNLLSEKLLQTASPRTGTTINMVTLVFKK